MFIPSPLFGDDAGIWYDEQNRLVRVGNRVMRFTPGEYRLVKILLTHRIAHKQLLIQALDTSNVENTSDSVCEEDLKRVTKHLCHIRGKMRLSGWQVVLLPGEGYRLVQPEV